MDGTLVDNMSYHRQSWYSFLSKYNIDVSGKAFSEWSHGTIDEIIIRLFGSLDPELLRDLGNEKEMMYRQSYAGNVTEIPGLLSFIDKVSSAGVLLGLGTMGNKDNIEFTLGELDIAHHFDAVVGGDDVERGKPHPDVFLEGAKRLHLKPENCIVFEDTAGGIQAGVNGNMRVVGVETSLSREDILRLGAFASIKDYHDPFLTQLL